jgi:hypothetical protein
VRAVLICKAGGLFAGPGDRGGAAFTWLGWRGREAGFCKLSRLAKPVGAASMLCAEHALFCKLAIEYIEKPDNS